jgi:hypothetical protein
MASWFSCQDWQLYMAFAQLTCREGLRDIEACLRAGQSTRDHPGIRARVARSTIADANQTGDRRMHADVAHCAIRAAQIDPAIVAGQEPVPEACIRRTLTRRALGAVRRA